MSAISAAVCPDAVAIGFEAARLDFLFMALDTLIYDG